MMSLVWVKSNPALARTFQLKDAIEFRPVRRRPPVVWRVLCSNRYVRISTYTWYICYMYYNYAHIIYLYLSISKIVNSRVRRCAMTNARAQATTTEAAFAGRIDVIRARFALKLADKIQQTDAALAQMAGDGSEAVDAVATAYRWFHDTGGIGQVVGFGATGLQAQACATILVGPFRAQRGLSVHELALLTSGLESLRTIALGETHSSKSIQGPAS